MLRINSRSKKLYNTLLLGIAKKDRTAVSLNGEKILVDSSHHSFSANFKALKAISEDKSRVAYLYLIAARQPIQVNVAFEYNGKMVLWSFREWWRVTQSPDKKPMDFYVDVTEGGGSTHFPVIGQLVNNALYSPNRYTEVYIAGNGSPPQLAVIVHHELRHVYLSKLGRDFPAGSHPDPLVNAETLAAENEALANSRQ